MAHILRHDIDLDTRGRGDKKEEEKDFKTY